MDIESEESLLKKPKEVAMSLPSLEDNMDTKGAMPWRDIDLEGGQSLVKIGKEGFDLIERLRLLNKTMDIRSTMPSNEMDTKGKQPCELEDTKNKTP
ncbi:hypothetical protein AAG906_003919 [Vitis piasezkii]